MGEGDTCRCHVCHAWPFNNNVIYEQNPQSSTLKKDHKQSLSRTRNLPLCLWLWLEIYRVHPLLHGDTAPLFPVSLGFLLQKVLDIKKKSAFSALFIDMVMWLLSLSQFMWWIIFIDFLKLNQSYTSLEGSQLDHYKRSFWICSWIWFACIFSRTFRSPIIRKIGL